MAIQTVFNKIKTDSIVRLMSAQIVVKATLDMSSDNGSILGTSADARALAIEPMKGEVQINGKVNFKTIFASGENGVLSLDYYADFTDSIKNDTILPSSRLLIKLNVIDTDSTVNGGDVTLTAVVEIVIDEIKSEEMESLVKIEDNVFSKGNNISCQYLKVMAEGAFEIFEEIETGSEIDKILIYDANVATTSVKCGVNTIMVSGEAYLAITYKSADIIVTKNAVIPFSEEIDAEGANPDSTVIPQLIVKNKRIVLSGSKDDNIIRAEMVVSVKAPVFAVDNAEILTDVFSPHMMLNVEDKCIDSYNAVKDICYKEKISAEANLDSDMPPIKTLLTSCLAQNNIANLIPLDGEITVEGLMTACVIYLDEEDRPTSVKAELPYSLTLIADGVMPDDKLSGYGMVYNVSAKTNNVNEIEVRADIRLCVSVTRKRSSRVITKLIEGDVVDKKLNAISIFIASGGEEMWDVVKNLYASPEDIMSQNPELNIPLKLGDKVRLYRRV